MKIKFRQFHSTHPIAKMGEHSVEEQINDYLKGGKREYVDVKYSIASYGSDICSSALLVYEESEPSEAGSGDFAERERRRGVRR